MGISTDERFADQELRRASGGREEVVMETPNVWLVGDRVRLFDGPFGWATVVAVTEEYVELVRPYVHTCDATVGAILHGSPGERLIDYIGQERFTIPRQDKRPHPTVFRATIPS